MATILSRKPGGGGGGGAPSGPAGGDLAGTYPNPTIDPTAAVITLAKDGSAGLAGNVTLSEGTGITLTQAGQDIEIASSAGAAVLTLLHDETKGADAANFDVTGIPGTHKHLHFILYARTTQVAALSVAQLRFNNDSGANYDSRYVLAGVVDFDAETAMSFGDVTGASAPAGVPGVIEAWIPVYAGTTFNKLLTGKYAAFGSDATSGNWDVGTVGGRWRDSSAITRITILPASGNWLAGSRLTIYGYS